MKCSVNSNITLFIAVTRSVPKVDCAPSAYSSYVEISSEYTHSVGEINKKL